jgi:hypothetical protein
MNAVSSKAAARTVTAMAMAAGLAVCLSAGAAQANPAAGAPHLGSGKDRVIMQAPTSAAAAATVSLSANAPRLVGGAAAQVTAQYKCPSGTEGYLDVTLVQVTGNTVARGYGSNLQPLTCNGTARTIRISVPLANDHPFKAGKAFGQGVLYAFNNSVEVTAGAERTITIT